MMHSSLAVTPEGLPLGLTAAKFWSRSKFKGTTALKRHVNPTCVPIETPHSGSARQSDRDLLRDQLAHILDDDDEPDRSQCAADPGL
jgi:hypothetical protein